MKNSGIEWIGEIPDDWNITTIKYACVFSPKCSKIVGLGIENEITYTPMEYIKNGYYIQNTKIIADIPSSLTMYEEGDIVMAKVTPCFENGNIARMDNLVNGVGVGSSELYVFRTKKYNRDYLFYLLQNYIFKDCAASTMIGTGGLKRVSSYFIKNSKQPFPPLSEQKTIAEFLDKKCGEVDALIADIQQEIETLEQYKRSVITEAVAKGLDPSVPMIDSGIDYLGRINSEWRLTKLGYICQKLNRPVPEKAEALICSNKGKVVLREDVSVGLISENDRMYQGVKVGDLCIHGMDTWHGAIAVSSLNGKITTVVHCCDSREDKRFIAYYLQMLAFKKVYKAISNGVRGNTSDFRSWDKAGDIYIVLPNKETQQQIADYLDKKCKEIEGVIAEKQSQIETLESYKKSLIYEYVTGKKEVG